MKQIAEIKESEGKDMPPHPSVSAMVIDVCEVQQSKNSQYKDKFFAVIANVSAAISVNLCMMLVRNQSSYKGWLCCLLTYW